MGNVTMNRNVIPQLYSSNPICVISVDVELFPLDFREWKSKCLKRAKMRPLEVRKRRGGSKLDQSTDQIVLLGLQELLDKTLDHSLEFLLQTSRVTFPWWCAELSVVLNLGLCATGP